MRIHSVTTCKVFIRGSYCIFRVFFRDQSKSHTYYRSIIWGVCQAASLLLWLRRVKIPILAKGRCCYLNNREIIYNWYGVELWESAASCTGDSHKPHKRRPPTLPWSPSGDTDPPLKLIRRSRRDNRAMMTKKVGGDVNSRSRVSPDF